MDITEASFEAATVVGIVAPAVPLSTFSLDKIREKSDLKFIGTLPDQILLADGLTPTIQGKIETNRLEFHTGNADVFNSGKFLNSIDSICKVAEEFGVKLSALGTNYLLRFVVANVNDSGSYIAENFSKKPEIEAKLGKKIISASTRIVWGEPKFLYDLKLHPIELEQKVFGAYLHIHAEFPLSPAGVCDVLKARFSSEPKEFEGILKKL
ncbi:MAG: hypothetical protein HYX59_08525 [Elusimicrobia bacterium]|nr:hypothetical protein [Elusimicrobiota bacterium]